MNLHTLKHDLALRNKNGLPFLLSGVVVWTLITAAFLLPIELRLQNIILLALTGLLFPVAVGLAGLLKADWKSKDNPLGSLGLVCNLAQFAYFPLVFWALGSRPEAMVFIFAVIAGAHFLPYGWLYDTKAYYLMAPVMAIISTLVGWAAPTDSLWAVPLAFLILLSILNGWLYADYKKKAGIAVMTNRAV
ncbi:DUF7010 family protein [Bhargavaea beijingensis]|uniref:Uncharacterized protein n=1 Tax=Bhargavaea beijingensis TaxID=426756 RepID=A0A1G7GW67_9BACL|nr:hypothetical protein [Bhargavaea beijingensis]MCW1927733.1 hypothetical protein [Bhargavaea beijingensis]RSK33390.1 hypothetical protein EJA12_06880 [Bhargavaea beijingensis]SDE92397.1 hypothetical protein SAMN04488126_13013 [Bhargavaea beijingensis]